MRPTAPERWKTTMEDDGGRRRLGRETALGGLLTADQVADAIVWAISQPSGVDVNTVIVRPTGQPG